jgi:hypothetical protein
VYFCETSVNSYRTTQRCVQECISLSEHTLTCYFLYSVAGCCATFSDLLDVWAYPPTVKYYEPLLLKATGRTGKSAWNCLDVSRFLADLIHATLNNSTVHILLRGADQKIRFESVKFYKLITPHHGNLLRENSAQFITQCSGIMF